MKEKFLNKIKDPKLKRATILAFRINGYKFSFLPSSLTGKFHPKDEFGKGGLDAHTEKVCWYVDKIADEFGYPDHTRDLLLVAAYFHDLGKVKDTTVALALTYKGKKTERSVTVTRNIGGADVHPIISSRMAREYMEMEGVLEEDIQVICDIVSKHMSHWYGMLPQPNSELEKMLALADFLASRREITFERESWWQKLKLRKR